MQIDFQSMKTEFEQETGDMLQSMEDGLLELQSGSRDDETINAVFRAIHTIKSTSSMFGLEQLAAFTHIAENLLDQMRNHEIPITDDGVEILLECKDHIQSMVDLALQQENGELDATTEETSQQLKNKLLQLQGDPSKTEHHEETGKEQASTETTVNEGDGKHLWHISARFTPQLFTYGLDPASILNYLNQIGNVLTLHSMTHNLPPLDVVDPEQWYIGYEIDLESDQEREKIEGAFDFVKEDSVIFVLSYLDEQEVWDNFFNSIGDEREMVQALLSEDQTSKSTTPLKEIKDESTSDTSNKVKKEESVSEETKKTPERKAATAQFLRVDATKVDHLIDLIGEMVIANATVMQISHPFRNTELNEAISVVSRMIEEMREGMMTIRMVQIGDTFNRFRRMVHDLAKELNKEVELEILGGETELDKTVIEKISDPLKHIIRNALDHGIESPQIREQNAKPKKGHLLLNAYQEQGSIAIEISDDGKGIDQQVIHNKAIERGLAEKERQYTKQEILSFIFEPGFSTAKEITNVSGRGVGMDVVRKNIESLRGNVEIDSTLGKGSRFLIRLPLTLAIVDGFLTRVGATYYVIPLEMVVECIELKNAHKKEMHGNQFINLRGEILPLIHVRKVFRQKQRLTQKQEHIVVTQFGSSKVGLVVDELHGELQTVIKPLGKMFRHLRGINGATILGSGEVALIIDIPILVDLVHKNIESRQERHSLVKETA